MCGERCVLTARTASGKTAYSWTERSAARLAHRSGGPGVASSNLAAPTILLLSNINALCDKIFIFEFAVPAYHSLCPLLGDKQTSIDALAALHHTSKSQFRDSSAASRLRSMTSPGLWALTLRPRHARRKALPRKRRGVMIEIQLFSSMLLLHLGGCSLWKAR